VTYRPEVLHGLARRLGSAAEARWIVEEVLGPPRHGLGRDEPVARSQLSAIDELAARRARGEPLQYALGHWSFRGLDLAVDERVLIPRPETEQVVEAALAELERRSLGPGGPVVVDLGTGSGAIALAIAVEASPRHAGLEVWATDTDPGALEVAAANRDRLAVADPAARRVVLVRGDWWAAMPVALQGRVDLAVANPPYVGEEEWPDLDAEVRCEPYLALVAGSGHDGTPGLAAVEALVAAAPAWLAPQGVLVVEIAPAQADAARALAREAGFDDVAVRRDLAGRDRMLVGRRR
jgi:release factor glutamine methyltransferase